ncbi:hypothetical protein GCM10007886_49690 [Methylobacterium gregans]|nr:hypothetical protein GCM10007886_49690 [Methylobacterium gregans]
MVELRHVALSALQRVHQVAHGVETDAVTLGDRLQPAGVVGSFVDHRVRLRRGPYDTTLPRLAAR